MNTCSMKRFAYLLLISLIFWSGMISIEYAQAFTLTVVGCDENNNCTLPVNGFQWILEEDNTNQKPPGIRVHDSLGVDIHKSHAPLVNKGTSNTNSVTVTQDVNGMPLNVAKKYFMSVLPNSGFTMGGANIQSVSSNVTVKVHQLPIPTAQISVLVFEDHNTINNVFDAGERVLSGFTIKVFDLAGPVSQDAFGNPLGTTYNPDGSVNTPGSGIILTDINGEALIKNLPPGKYGTRAIPPAGTNWIQTATIEGTPTVDAWVKANEPPKFFEGFGTGFFHVFIGFVDPNGLPWVGSGPGGSTISGRNVFNHFSRPPTTQGFFPGPPVSECWVGLNDTATQTGLIALPCDADSYFSIPGVPPGTYQLVTWDKPLDALFGFNTVTVPATNIDLGNVLSFRWFGTLIGNVFQDNNQNGFRDCYTPNCDVCVTEFCDDPALDDEVGIENQVVNIRFRDGSIYQSTVSDPSGEYGLTEVFPFFKWLVTEVDFARLKATGMTTAIDYGGQIPPASPPPNAWIMPSFDVLNPQPQATVNPNTGNNLSRTETGPVLLQAMHLFLNQTNVIDWGKTYYGLGENGGITGIVYYSVTRAENNPQLGRPEPWEPGIPRVQVNLYADTNSDGLIDDLNGDGIVTRADVDNYPFGNFPGPEDIDRNRNTRFNGGDAINVATTDSWDDNLPSGCIQTIPIINGLPVKECFDNFGTWNQVRPGVFDGGYAIASYFPGGMDSGSTEVDGLPTGHYIIEAVTPPGYELVKEEDKNVDFGETYVPAATLPPCVGDLRPVPQYLSLFPDALIEVVGWFPGMQTNLCDRKWVLVDEGQNTASDFFFFTEVPKAARNVGFVNNDLTAEFNANSPIFGEKAAPAWIPISYQDWQGNEIVRVYSDEFGTYNALLPSTYTMNIAAPSGVSPNVITIVLNHPFLPNGTVDPYYDPQYAIAPWTFQFMPGTSSYTDTPNVPIAAFVGFPKGGTDMEPPSGTPVISKVVGPEGGPLVCSSGGILTIQSAGSVQVPNPDYDPTVPGSTALITRDYSFGGGRGVAGNVKVGNQQLNIISWNTSTIRASVPVGTATGQLMVTRADNNKSSEIGVTLHVVNCATAVRRHVSSGQSIQAAIDASSPGDLILVNPGTYHENVILYKNVILQGSGAGASINDPNATIIYANPSPQERLAAWHNKVIAIRGNNPFLANEAPGVMVFGDVPGSGFVLDPAPVSKPLVDGFMIFGAVQGGGVCAYNQSHHLVISNNKIRANQGSYGGGITLGQPDIGTGILNNGNIVIQYNRIAGNGGVFGAGGIDITSGSDNYSVMKNIVVGNLSRWNGGGIAHDGLSNNGLIANNKITFNEVFFGAAVGGDGGGIYIGGEIANGAIAGALGAGAGNVTVNANLIQGNLSGSGSGGGIRVLWFNGQDVSITPYSLNIFNNMIVNNVAGLAGGGIALQDVSQSNIINNTIAHNDSTATAANAFAAGSLDSTPQGAGIVSSVHSGALSDATGQMYSDPVLINNILWQNRSFYNDHTLNAGAGGLAPNPAMPAWDLDVKGVAGLLNPQNCILSDVTGYAPSNISANPGFLGGYLNQLFSATVLDEAGNAITVRFTPIKPGGDYHISNGSPAVNLGTGPLSFAELAQDFDGQARPNPGGGIDSGADELYSVGNYAISGTVRTSIGAPIAGVTVNLGGASTATTTTNALGNYTFTGLANGAYTVTPSLAGYLFVPANRNVTVNNANVSGQNFTGTVIRTTYSISGTVSTSGGAPIAGVIITLAGAANATATTNASGNYSFTGLANGSYTVTPGLTGYTFSPVTRNITVSGANITGQNFTGTAASGAYSISGNVKNSNGSPLAGVTMTLTGSANTVTTTNAQGNYTFGGLAPGVYVVTPGFNGYTFLPSSRTIAIVNQNFTGQDFQGQAARR